MIRSFRSSQRSLKRSTHGIRDDNNQSTVLVRLTVHTDHVLRDRSRVEILKVNEEPAFQFLRERQMIFMCIAVQEISAEDCGRRQQYRDDYSGCA